MDKFDGGLHKNRNKWQNEQENFQLRINKREREEENVRQTGERAKLEEREEEENNRGRQAGKANMEEELSISNKLIIINKENWRV